MSIETQRSRPLSMTIATTPAASSSLVQTQHPKSSYEQIAADERVFMETLEDLHKSLGTKFAVPTIGGKPVDLHRLFMEVTCRGGLRKVIGDRKWKEVTSVFTFPTTITNASFVLRKYYISLLQKYEQVYYPREVESKHPSNDVKASSVSEAPATISPIMPKSNVEHQSTASMLSVEKGHPPQLRIGSILKGKIDAKIEDGYIVSANLGSEILNGVLYHVPMEPQNLPIYSHGRGRKRSKESDPYGLNSNNVGYNIFFDEQCSIIGPQVGREKVVAKHIIALWDRLPEYEKEVYRCREAKSSHLL